MYCGIEPNALAALLNDEDILDIEPLSVDGVPVKPHVPTRNFTSVNPISA